MNNFRQCALCIGTSVLILLVSGCSGVFDAPEGSKEIQIKKSFAKTLDMYPIK
ncbi:tandem-type lipoprotein, partial [Staphylococcus aureus]